MRCYICNAVLVAEEVKFDRRYTNQRYGPYVPCGSCLTEIDEVFEDPLEESEMNHLIYDEALVEEDFENYDEVPT